MTPQIVPPWLILGLGELGTVEAAGSRHNPRILEYHRCTTLKATEDEVPWCAAFACWCLEGGELGHAIKSPRTASSRAFLKWGVEVPRDKPRLGDIAVFSRTSNPAFGHVGFVLDVYGGMIQILNGNVRNRVCISSFGIQGLLGYRRPPEVMP